jgi:hypothetical protein
MLRTKRACPFGVLLHFLERKDKIFSFLLQERQEHQILMREGMALWVPTPPYRLGLTPHLKFLQKFL